MDPKQRSSRILVFPWLAHGHVFPFFELSKKLSRANFHIYFCSTPVNLDSIRKSFKKDLSDGDVSMEFVELHLQSLPELPTHHHTTKNLPPHLMPVLMQAFQNSSSRFSDIMSNVKPDLLIYDGFQPWSAKLASSQGIPAVHFATSSATALSFYHHLHTYKTFDTFPYAEIYLGDHEKRDLLAQGESIKVEDSDEGFCFGIFNLSRDIVLIKSCSGIEGKYIDYLSTLCHRKIVPVGSLITETTSQEDSSDIMDWLSQKSQSSTLYISFGSENYLSKDQIQEIAKGLELTKVNFIWVARFPDGSSMEGSNGEENELQGNDSELLQSDARQPQTRDGSYGKKGLSGFMEDGFRDRVKERGLIVHGWAPQAKIVAHPSIGGFMSHCGWSSIMESIHFGIPVLAVPLKLDQPVNCRLVVEAGVGVEVVMDENGKLNGEDVAKAINKVIVEESGEGLRYNVREFSDKIKMEEEQAFYEVAKKLSGICMKR